MRAMPRHGAMSGAGFGKAVCIDESAAPISPRINGWAASRGRCGHQRDRRVKYSGAVIGDWLAIGELPPARRCRADMMRRAVSKKHRDAMAALSASIGHSRVGMTSPCQHHRRRKPIDYAAPPMI